MPMECQLEELNVIMKMQIQTISSGFDMGTVKSDPRR